MATITVASYSILLSEKEAMNLFLILDKTCASKNFAEMSELANLYKSLKSIFG